MTTFKSLGPARQVSMMKQCVEQIEQALAKIGMDPDGVLVLIDDGFRVAAHFSGTENSAKVMVECVNNQLGKPSCCKSR
jgi:phosphomannomutase